MTLLGICVQGVIVYYGVLGSYITGKPIAGALHQPFNGENGRNVSLKTSHLCCSVVYFDITQVFGIVGSGIRGVKQGPRAVPSM